MNESDLIVAFGASFSNHTGICPYTPIIQVDHNPMAIGRFHPVTVGVLGHVGVTAAAMPMPYPTDVKLELLTKNSRRSSCPYKGDSAFFDGQVRAEVVRDLAWTYVPPQPESTPIAGLISFYNEGVRIDIDGERQPRPASHFT